LLRLAVVGPSAKGERFGFSIRQLLPSLSSLILLLVSTWTMNVPLYDGSPPRICFCVSDSPPLSPRRVGGERVLQPVFHLISYSHFILRRRGHARRCDALYLRGGYGEYSCDATRRKCLFRGSSSLSDAGLTHYRVMTWIRASG
jgi:hypothetical protein